MRNARLLHYSHCVSDVERSRRFYTEVLGFEVVAEFDFDEVLDRMEKNAEKFNVDKIRQEDVVRAGGAGGDEE